MGKPCMQRRRFYQVLDVFIGNGVEPRQIAQVLDEALAVMYRPEREFALDPGMHEHLVIFKKADQVQVGTP